MDVHEVRSSPSSGLRWLTGTATAVGVFSGLVAAGCLVGLLTQQLGGVRTLQAVVVGALAVWGTVAAFRGARALRAAGRPELLARLDAEGLHVREAVVVVEDADGHDVPDHLGWTTVPWGWIGSVTLSTLDLRTAKALGADTPLEVLRFALTDDRLLDAGPVDPAHLAASARLLGLTASQTRTVLLAEADRSELAAAAAWVSAHRPGLAVVSGTSLPWSTRATPDPSPESPRVAVVGASGRLGRRVVEVLARREKVAPVAVARNEVHRAELERLGAEVRMADLDQGPVLLGDALRGCAAVVHVASSASAVVIEAARRAGVQRLLLVPGSWNGDEVVALAASSGLAWTALRPAVLTDDEPTGEVQVGQDLPPGPIPRGDLAEVLVAAVRDEDSVGAAFAVAGAPGPAARG